MIDKDGRKYFRRLREEASAVSGIINITGISESRSAAVAGLIAKARGGQTLIVTSSYGRAKRLAEDLPLFVTQKVLLFPDEDRSHMVYEAKSHHELIERLSVLTALAKNEDCIVVAPALSAVKKIAPKEIFSRYAFTLRVGQEENTDELRSKLVRMGYERTGLVESRGQFSFRGGILDVFPPDFEYPCRIEFFDVEVDSIRFFDPLTQRSLHKSEEATIFPAEQIISEEFLFEQTANRIRTAYEHFSQKLTGEKREKLAERENRILEYLSTGTNIQYLENYISYFYEQPAYLWDYLKPGSSVITDDHDRIMDTLAAAEKEFTEEFKVRLDRGEVVPEDFKAFSGEEEFLLAYRGRPSFLFSPFQKQLHGIETLEGLFSIQSKQAPVFNGRMDFLESELRRCDKQKYDIFIVCATAERVRNMQDFLERCKLSKRVTVYEGVLSGGMEFPEEKLVIFCDKDIFATTKYKRNKTEAGERENDQSLYRYTQRRLRRSRKPWHRKIYRNGSNGSTGSPA